MSQSPSADYAGAEDGRKRVAKACDRCRLKKIKCDGKVPCSRCTSESSICKFGDRKKSVERRVPPGYVEYLEDSHKTFVEAIKTLWKEHQEASSTDGQDSMDIPPVHVILDDLGLVSLPNRSPVTSGVISCRMDDPEDIRSHFEAEHSATQSKASSNSSGSPMIKHEGPTGLSQENAGRTAFDQVSPRSSIAAQKNSLKVPDGSSVGFMQGMTSLDSMANFGGPVPLNFSRYSAQALPTPQPSAGMEETLWNDYSYFGSSNFDDFDMTNDAFDMGDATDSLQQRMDYQQDVAMSMTDSTPDMRWINSQASGNTYGMASA